MPEIKPDEISAILRQQLGGFNASADLEEVGSVLQIGDGIARVYGLGNVRAGELVEFENGAIGSFEASRFSTGRKNRMSFEIYGSKGSISFDLEKMNALRSDIRIAICVRQPRDPTAIRRKTRL